ncbi:MAG: hypothetical protein A2675_01690 [Candidatus Yonathbacteria bacterium RIFCSPHIGHO2_01_FULL_51_10]|uniref:Uncharacterized protein n=1 Tax=Candidatus Yonathbacteria bacterium RIFCSPHIGHO2_01_FULL_51_10 TaxID=1802723 RepID=A0A1G2S6U0_9BACT|nr:MAG: hypothetical protein A2675_01690 [Candidatus Yonathbacteria bacterium RIFCSPHIGHO2_01_FULL_51_10]
MRDEITVPPASAELFIRQHVRKKFKPILHYQPTLCLLSIYTEDVSYVAAWVSPALEVFFRNHPTVDNTAVGLSICCRLHSSPEEMLGAYCRRELGFMYPLFRWWYNATRKLIPARELLAILGIIIPREAWGDYKHQVMKVLETPVFVRLA